MDLNKLRTFKVVAELGSITKAAERLYRTQPAISNQLKDLEEELKLSLFERKNARIYLTKEGSALYEIAKDHIGKLEDAAIRLRDDRSLTEGLIRIAVEQDTVSYLLPELITRFNRLFPNVRFKIVTSQFGRIEDLLLSNEVDFILTVLFQKKDFFDTLPFVTFSRSLVASPSYLDKFPKVERIEDLLNFNLISFSSELGDMRFWLKKNGHSKHISLFEKQATSIVVSDAYTLNEMLFSGVGIGFSFDNMAGQRAFNKQKLVSLFPDHEPIYVGVDLAFRKIRNESYIFQSFRECVISMTSEREL